MIENKLYDKAMDVLNDEIEYLSTVLTSAVLERDDYLKAISALKFAETFKARFEKEVGADFPGLVQRPQFEIPKIDKK